MTRWVAMLAVMLCHVVAGQAHVLVEPARIQVKIVKYDGLKEIVRQNRGNVVVVYFWTTCNLPAVKWHADILAIHRKHKAKGLVTVSVAMDQAGETGGDETPKQRDERVLERLTRLNSAVVNVVLDESHQSCPKDLAFLARRLFMSSTARANGIVCHIVRKNCSAGRG